MEALEFLFLFFKLTALRPAEVSIQRWSQGECASMFVPQKDPFIRRLEMPSGLHLADRASLYQFISYQ